MFKKGKGPSKEEEWRWRDEKVEEVDFKFREQVVHLKLTSNTLDFIYRRIQGWIYEMQLRRR
jgi:hypothetical protein